MSAACILLRGGTYFDLRLPTESEFTIEDIAHALAKLCRFTGHCDRFYSVAEHSVHTSYLVPPQLARAALMHDAAEAFVGDVSSPLKILLPDYRAVEQRVAAAIAARFDLVGCDDLQVKQADLWMLYQEQQQIMPPHLDEWPCFVGVPNLGSVTIEGWQPAEAAVRFLDRWVEVNLPGRPHRPQGAIVMSDKREEARAVQLDCEAAFLTALAEHGIRPDIQELLVSGDGRGRVAPGGLRKALAAAFASRPTAAEQGEGVPAGMVPWHGGDEAPTNWSSGKVQLRSGKIRSASYVDDDMWVHDDMDLDIVAYEPQTPLATQPNEPEAGELRERVVNELVEEGRAKHRVLNDEQQDAADAEARAFYRKVIDRYVAAALSAAPSSILNKGEEG